MAEYQGQRLPMPAKPMTEEERKRKERLAKLDKEARARLAKKEAAAKKAKAVPLKGMGGTVDAIMERQRALDEFSSYNTHADDFGGYKKKRTS